MLAGISPRFFAMHAFCSVSSAVASFSLTLPPLSLEHAPSFSSMFLRQVFDFHAFRNALHMMVSALEQRERKYFSDMKYHSMSGHSPRHSILISCSASHYKWTCKSFSLLSPIIIGCVARFIFILKV